MGPVFFNYRLMKQEGRCGQRYPNRYDNWGGKPSK